MTKRLVTGGAGYIGCHLVRAIQSSNLEEVIIELQVN
ncbi:NAD-dependent epimerase/dehydratase family protein [Candidatus Planktophila lacus]